MERQGLSSKVVWGVRDHLRVTRRHEPADQEWERLRELLPPGRTGHSREDGRRILSGIGWKVRAGSAWRTGQHGGVTVRGGRARDRSSAGVFRG
ncbi:transposase [Streptosporangium canum]|uniref:transposase n=1 Tax=Streptosporangium canum TaxID=324952 RepID=UPI003799356C